MVEIKSGAAVYSKSEEGNKTIYIYGKPTNFKVKEFACHDGSDKMIIEEDLVRKLQILREKVGAIRINSAYRTPSHNARVGGVTTSQHVYGRAADIVAIHLDQRFSPLLVAIGAEIFGFTGVGVYSDFTHVDVRPNRSMWDYTPGKIAKLSSPSFLRTVKIGDNSVYASIVQYILGGLTIDGVYGAKTKNAVIEFQREYFDDYKDHDGIVGPKTWRAMFDKCF